MTMTETAPKTETALQNRPPLPFEPANLDQAYRFCEFLSKADLVPDSLKRKPADIMVIFLAARDFGLTVTEAFRAIHVIKGKPALASAFKIARARQHPDCEFFRLVETTNEKATWETKRKGDAEPTRITWTAAQAKAAGLGGDNWAKYTATMLRWRAGSALADAVYSDAFYGAPTLEEVEAEEVEPGVVVAPPAVVVPVAEKRQTRTEALREKVKAKGVVVQRADLGQTEEQAMNGEPPPLGEDFAPGDIDAAHDAVTGEIRDEPGSNG